MMGLDNTTDVTGTPWHLVDANGALVAIVQRSDRPERGDMIVASGETWRVCDTLGEVARVVPLVPSSVNRLRISASSETAARALEDSLGHEAEARSTPSGWVVTFAADQQSRVRALARLADAARTVLGERTDDEFFLLDCGRPVRIPPRT